MNAKFVFAVLLIFQVSLALGEWPTPEPDLVVKYDDLKATFRRRLENLFLRLQAANTDAGAQVDTQKLGTAKEVLNALGEEVSPLLNKPRTGLLGLYSQYARPYLGEYLQDGINRLKVLLDQVAPADK